MTISPFKDPHLEDFRIAHVAFGLDDVHVPGGKTQLSKWFDQLTAGIKALNPEATEPPRCILIRRNLSHQIATLALPQKPVHSGWEMQQGIFKQPWIKSNKPVGRILNTMRNLEVTKLKSGYPVGYVINDENFTTKFIAVAHPINAKLDELFSNLQQYSEPQNPSHDRNNPRAIYISQLYRMETPVDELTGDAIKTSNWRTFDQWVQLNNPIKIYDPFEL